MHRKPFGILFALVSGLAFALAGCGEPSTDPSSTGAAEGEQDRLRADPRIAKLLTDCPQRSFYDEDIGQTTVLIERLVDKLENGQLEVLKRAKEELAEIGAPVVPSLQRLIERRYSNAFHAPYVENALGAASLMKDPAARELLLMGFDHPQETVRAMAVTGLRLFHAAPEDFDRLLERLAAPEGEVMRNNLAKALFRADRARAEQIVLGWLRAGEEKSLWTETVPELCSTRDPGVRAACAELFSEIDDPRFQGYLATTGAAGGDKAAREWLTVRFAEAPWNERMLLVDALSKTGWLEPLVAVALDDSDPNVSLLAADHLGQEEGWNEERRNVLVSLLDSADPKVRSQMLRRLVERGDAEAIDRAIAQLQLDSAEPLQAALLALRGPIREDADLRERVRAALVERNERDQGAPLQERKRTIKAIGIHPSAWAAETLVEIAHAHEGERLEGLRAHEWIMIHAGNSDDVGRARLFELLAEEEDPLARLDLIRAVSIERTDQARELLLQLAESGTQSELELLFTCDRLARVGPSHLVAPRMKRILFNVEETEVRRALSCLLWHWY